MTVNEMQKQTFAIGSSKGLYSDKNGTSVGDFLMMMVSELAEAFEEHRNNQPLTEIYYKVGNNKPEGVPIELADAVLRIMGFCELNGIDLEKACKIKMLYNSTRPQMHGGKRF